jgi:lipoprotein-anchoring transpeptidase ErfK/SrfK
VTKLKVAHSKGMGIAMKRVLVCWAATVLAIAGSAGQAGLLAATRTGTAARAASFAGPVAPTLAKVKLAKGDSLVADAKGSEVPIFEAPDAPMAIKALKNPTFEGVPLVFGVKEQKGEWLHVMIPERPNGSTAWIRTSDVELRAVPNRILVELNKHRLSVWRGDQMLMEAPVGVGTPRTPTPLGSFYVDVSVPFQSSGGPYGAYMLSVAGFSNVHLTFAGGRGQIAIHGTNNLGSVGKDSSNGCLRLTNDVILQVKDLAPTGTPVDIVA